MGWFSGKSAHKREVEAAYTVLSNLFDKTTKPGGQEMPAVLQFAAPDSQMRYLMFCLSTVQVACARRMTNPDAVLNELLHRCTVPAVNDPGMSQVFFGGAVDPQQGVNQASDYLGDYLHRWSAYLDISSGGNDEAAMSIVCAMLRTTESSEPPTGGDGRRLMPLASWIVLHFLAMESAFKNMVR